MRIRTEFHLGAATIAIMLALAGAPGQVHAQTATPVAITSNDIGVVTSPNGPEAVADL
jgi:hypothetical protein